MKNDILKIIWYTSVIIGALLGIITGVLLEILTKDLVMSVTLGYIMSVIFIIIFKIIIKKETTSSNSSLNFKNLFNKKNTYKNFYFDQYKLYVEFSSKLSDRRLRDNNFLLTINTALVAFLGVASQMIGNNYKLLPWIILVSFIGSLICYLPWRNLIKSYEELIVKKFRIICEMENKLPSSPFGVEKNIQRKTKN